jgi:hypothetical protein
MLWRTYALSDAGLKSLKTKINSFLLEVASLNSFILTSKITRSSPKLEAPYLPISYSESLIANVKQSYRCPEVNQENISYG